MPSRNGRVGLLGRRGGLRGGAGLRGGQSAEVNRTNFKAFSNNITCVSGSNERFCVQEWLKRTSSKPSTARFSHICTRFRSFEANLHVTFAKRTENSLEPKLHAA